MDKNNFQKVNIKDISIDPKNPYGKDLIKEINKKYSLMESKDEDLPEPPKIWEKKNRREIRRKGWK